MRRWHYPLPGLLTLLLAWSQPALAAAADDWRMLRDGNITIYGDMDPRRLRDIVNDIRIFEAAVLNFSTTARKQTTLPLTIIALDGASWRERNTGLPRVGVFLGDEFSSAILIRADAPRAELWPTLYHEYAHHLLNATSTIEIPSWYREGWATLWQSFERKGNTILIGRPGAWPWSWLDREPWMPLERVMSTTPYDSTWRERATFYAEALVFVHYVTLGKPERMPQVQRYLRPIDLNFRQDEAFRKAFDLSYEELEAELRMYHRRKRLPVIETRIASLPVRGDTPVELAPPREAAPALAYAAEILGTDRTVVAASYEDALTVDASSAQAAAGLARLQIRAGNEAAGLASLEALATRSGLSDDERLDLAQSLLVIAQPEDGAAPPAAFEARLQRVAGRMRDMLEPMVHRPEPSLAAVNYWSMAVHSLRADPAPAIAIVSQALARYPASAKLTSRLAELYALSGDAERARELQGRAALLTRNVARQRKLLRDMDEAGAKQP